MGVIEHLHCERRPRLSEFVRECERRILAAERRRIESHQKLWPILAADPYQRRAHMQLERNLLEGLTLLHAQRAIFLHELRGAKFRAKSPRPPNRPWMSLPSPMRSGGTA
jgi:hypothetical protein